MIFYVERQKQTLEVVKMSNQLIKCKVCGEEIAKGAKTCPKCGNKNKKPFYKKWWFIALVIVIVIAAIASSGGDETAPVSNGGENTQTQTETQSIEYVAYNVSDMMEDSIPTDFNVGMNANVDSLDFNNNSYSKDNLVTAFQQALSGMTIKISEDLFGELVIDKVEKVVYG